MEQILKMDLKMKKYKYLLIYILITALSLILAGLGFHEAAIVIGSINSITLIMFSLTLSGRPSSVFIVIGLFLSYIPIITFIFSLFYTSTGLTFNGNTINDLGYSFYFSLVTWTTLGYGDLQPTDPAKMWAASQAVFGYIFMAVSMALFVNTLSRASEYKKSKSVRAMLLELTYDWVGGIQCGLHNAINLDEPDRVNEKFFVDLYIDRGSAHLNFTNQYSALIGIDMMSEIAKIKPLADLLAHKMVFAYRKNPNGSTAMFSPLNEWEKIEEALQKIQEEFKGVFEDNRLMEGYSFDKTKDLWERFCVAERIFEPEDYKPSGKIAYAFDNEAMKHMGGLKLGMKVNRLFSV